MSSANEELALWDEELEQRKRQWDDLKTSLDRYRKIRLIIGLPSCLAIFILATASTRVDISQSSKGLMLVGSGLALVIFGLSSLWPGPRIRPLHEFKIDKNDRTAAT